MIDYSTGPMTMRAAMVKEARTLFSKARSRTQGVMMEWSTTLSGTPERSKIPYRGLSRTMDASSKSGSSKRQFSQDR